jgi:hypothetical protein
MAAAILGVSGSRFVSASDQRASGVIGDTASRPELKNAYASEPAKQVRFEAPIETRRLVATRPDI